MLLLVAVSRGFYCEYEGGEDASELHPPPSLSTQSHPKTAAVAVGAVVAGVGAAAVAAAVGVGVDVAAGRCRYCSRYRSHDCYYCYCYYYHNCC